MRNERGRETNGGSRIARGLQAHEDTILKECAGDLGCGE
jgi:hypothetical protein